MKELYIRPLCVPESQVCVVTLSDTLLVDSFVSEGNDIEGFYNEEQEW